MDKNNRKLKLLYKCIKANTSAICCTYHQLKYSSPNRSNKQKQKKKTRAAQKSPPFENGGLGEKRSGEWVKSVKG